MPSTKKELASGVLYTTIAKYSSTAVQLGVSAILARLLTPADYGVVTIATVFILFFNIISDIGIGPAIIQFKDLDRQDLCNIFSFTACAGSCMCILFFLSSWPIASYYNNDTLVPVCQWLSLAILFNCLNIVPQNLQYKRKRFRFTAIVSLSANIITAIMAICMAYCGFGVYTLVFQQISSVFIIFVAYYFQDKLTIVFKIDWAPLKRISSYSTYQFLFNFINYFSRNLDKLLVGRFVGIAPLGQYEKSYRLMMMPLQNITSVVTPVMQPIFSNFQNDLQVMAEKYIKLFAFLCCIGFPISILLFFSGKELVLLVFGNQWFDAIFPFRILALTVGFQIVNGTAGSIYQSANATRQLFISGCWCAFFMITSFVITIWVWNSINAVAIGFAIAQLLNSTQTYYLLFKTLHYPIRKVLTTMIYPLVVSIVIGVVLFLICPYCDNLSMILSFIIKSVVVGVIWFVSFNYVGPYQGVLDVYLTKFRHKR